MSRNPLRKQSSYSEFRKRSCSNKGDLSKSLIDLQTSLSNIMQSNITQIHTPQNSLLTTARKRSLSGRIRTMGIEDQSHRYSSTKIISDVKDVTQMEERIYQSNFKKTTVQSNTLILNRMFEPIQQSSIQNEQDNGLQKHQTKFKIQNFNKVDKNNMTKKKQTNSFKGTSSQKMTCKPSIDQLTDMQKRLQSVKNKKIQVGVKNLKKSDIIPKPQLTDRKVSSSASQSNFLKQRRIKINQVSCSEREITNIKSNFLKKPSINQANSTILQQKLSKNQQTDSLIPTQMITSQQKQKLLLQIEYIKKSIQNTQICVSNMQQIRRSIKQITKCIN